LGKVVVFKQPCFFAKHDSYSALELESVEQSAVFVLEDFGDPDQNVFLADEFVRITGSLPGEYYKVSVIFEIEEAPMPKGFRPGHLLSPQYNWEDTYEEYNDNSG